MIRVLEFVSYSCLIWTHMQQFCFILCCEQETCICCASKVSDYLGYISNLAPVSSSFSSVSMSFMYRIKPTAHNLLMFFKIVLLFWMFMKILLALISVIIFITLRKRCSIRWKWRLSCTSVRNNVLQLKYCLVRSRQRKYLQALLGSMGRVA